MPQDSNDVMADKSIPGRPQVYRKQCPYCGTTFYATFRTLWHGYTCDRCGKVIKWDTLNDKNEQSSDTLLWGSTKIVPAVSQKMPGKNFPGSFISFSVCSGP